MKAERKKFMFYDSPKRQADLRIKLQQDNMNQSEFFRAMITGYLQNDHRIVEFIENFKEHNKLQGKRRRSQVHRDIKEGNENKTAFGLGEEEIENIFDLIEKENPDL